MIFLDNNGFDIIATNDDVIAIGLGVADGQLNKADATAWMHTFAKPVRGRPKKS